MTELFAFIGILVVVVGAIVYFGETLFPRRR